MYAALLAVLATLKLEFAATTAMAMGLADMVKKPLLRLVKPPLEKLLPPPSHQWITPTIDSIVRLSAIAIAWYVQQIISAFYSALRGGKLFADGLFNILGAHTPRVPPRRLSRPTPPTLPTPPTPLTPPTPRVPHTASHGLSLLSPKVSPIAMKSAEIPSLVHC